jgi:2-amino-4-hydroxy-6-hydroxymethyldihydropteridine diphosphokinase
MASASYVIGLGSNRPHGRHGRPEEVLRAAIDALASEGLTIIATSRTRRTIAMGPSDRDFANAATRIESPLSPPDLLALLQRIERAFGRRRHRRWGARVLDLDILAWSGGEWAARTLAIPHGALAKRIFALGPAAEVAPEWRHPRLHVTLRQLEAQRRKAHPVDRSRPGQ